MSSVDPSVSREQKIQFSPSGDVKVDASLNLYEIVENILMRTDRRVSRSGAFFFFDLLVPWNFEIASGSGAQRERVLHLGVVKNVDISAYLCFERFQR